MATVFVHNMKLCINRGSFREIPKGGKSTLEDSLAGGGLKFPRGAQRVANVPSCLPLNEALINMTWLSPQRIGDTNDEGHILHLPL